MRAPGTVILYDTDVSDQSGSQLVWVEVQSGWIEVKAIVQ